MKTIQASPQKIICSNPDSPFCYFGWPTIARLPDSTLAMVASGFRLKHVCPFGKVIISYSRDEGANWTAPAIVMDTPLDDRDAGIIPFGSGSDVMLTSFNNSIAAQRGWNTITKGEHKWKGEAMKGLSEAYLKVLDEIQPEEKFLGSTFRISRDGGYTFGPMGRFPVTAPHGPCSLQDGGLLYVGRIFSCDDSFKAGDPQVQCWHIDADGHAEYLCSIENINDGGDPILSCEPHCIQLPDGKIIVHIRVERHRSDRDLFTVYQAESDDNGKSFSKPRQILEDKGGSPAHLMLHSSGVLVSTYGYREAPYGIRAMFSRDGGKTWDTDYMMYDGGKSGDLGYPATVELKDGSLLTVYYENIGGQSVIMQQTWRLPV